MKTLVENVMAFLCRCGRLWDALEDGWIVGHHQEVDEDGRVVSYCRCNRELARTPGVMVDKT